MQNDLGLKLIAVMDAHVLKFYEAQGLKVTKHIKAYKLSEDTNHTQAKHQGFSQTSAGQSTFYDPHTSAKDIETQVAAKNAICHIEEILHGNNTSYKELVIIASSKMLGLVRNKLNKNIQNLVSKEIAKDLTHHDKDFVEKAVFG